MENPRQGFQPCFEAGIRELPFLMPEPAEKPSLHGKPNVEKCQERGGYLCHDIDLGHHLPASF